MFVIYDLKHAGVTQLVECHPSKVNVAGSTPVARSSLLGTTHLEAVIAQG